MTIEILRDALKEQPFRPFTICLADGRRYPVPHPEFAWIPPSQQRRFHVAMVDSPMPCLLSLSMVTSLEFESAEADEDRPA